MSPLVNVLLPVYNGEAYLEEAIQSILDQTYSNFELLIFNDGSTDRSAKIIKGFSDPRIVQYEQPNQGLAATLNNAIKASNGMYLARQDQDDISLPKRFEKQVEFLNKHFSCGVVGTWADCIEAGTGKISLNNKERSKRPPSENLALKFHLLFSSPFVHSSVMIRRSVIEKVGLYSTDKGRQPPEDYELWSRIGRQFEMANIPEVLHVYRRGPGSMTKVAGRDYIERATRITIENICCTLGLNERDQNVCDLAALVNAGYHRVSYRPSFDGISMLLKQLADTLSGGAGSNRDVVRTMARRCFLSIRKGHYIIRYGKILGRLLYFSSFWRNLHR